ncbi:MAG: hypothetical protein ACUVS3_07560 [Thermodesulfobacteriota bacterium]
MKLERLDVSFGFERHFIRAIHKERLRVGLAVVGRLAMAVGAIEPDCQERDALLGVESRGARGSIASFPFSR